MSIKSIKEKELLVNFARAKYEPDDGPLTELQIEQIKESVKEPKNELVQTQPKKKSPETETSVSDTTEPVAEQTFADRTTDFITKTKGL